jgi:hypothetical protein
MPIQGLLVLVAHSLSLPVALDAEEREGCENIGQEDKAKDGRHSTTRDGVKDHPMPRSSTRP